MDELKVHELGTCEDLSSIKQKLLNATKNRNKSSSNEKHGNQGKKNKNAKSLNFSNESIQVIHDCLNDGNVKDKAVRNYLDKVISYLMYYFID